MSAVCRSILPDGRVKVRLASIRVEDEDIGLELIRHGFGGVDTTSVPEEYLLAYEEAITNDLIKTDENESPILMPIESGEALLKTEKEADVVVEDVITGASFRCFFPSLNLMTFVYMTGILPASDKALADEAKEFMEQRILQRDLKFRVDGSTQKSNHLKIFGTFLHPQKGLISEYLLKAGLATIDTESIKFLRVAQQEVLKNAVNHAKSLRLKVWASENEQSTSSNTPKHSTEMKSGSRVMTVGSSFYGKVVDIYSGTCLLILEAQPEGHNVTPYNTYHVVYLSHLRCNIRGWQSASRKCIQELCGGDRLVFVELDYMRFPTGEFTGQVSDDLGRLHHVTIKELNKDGSIGRCLNCEMVKRGLARVDIIRNVQGQELSKCYTEMVDLFRAQPSSIVAPPPPKFNDLIGPTNTKRAKQLFPSFQNEDKLDLCIERVVSGSKFRAYVPNYKAMVAISLSGVACPQTFRATQVDDEVNGEIQPQPFAEECIKWSQINLLFRHFDARFNNCDPTGCFGVVLSYRNGEHRGQTVQEVMLKSGFAMVFDKYPGPNETFHRECENLAVREARGIWSIKENVIIFGRGQDETRISNAIGSWGNVNISHCEGATEVYVQKHSESSELRDLQRLIQEEMKVAKDNFSPYPPPKNCILMAKFEDLWYRAKVLAVNEATGVVTVFFLDYGNQSEVFKPEDVAELPASCNVIAYTPLAHKVSLAYIKNPSIDVPSQEACCDLIMDFGEDQTCQCECISLTAAMIPEVVIKRGGRDLINELLLNGVAKLQKPFTVRKNLTSAALKMYAESESKARDSRLNIWAYGDIGDTDDEA